MVKLHHSRDAGDGGGGQVPPPSFWISVYLIQTKGGQIMPAILLRAPQSFRTMRHTLFGKQAKSSESLLNLRGLGKWLFWAKTRLLAVP